MFEAGHLSLIERPHETAAPVGRDVARGLEEGPAYTALIDGRVVACAGLQRLWPGVAEGWAIVEAGLGPRAGARLHRAVATGLAIAMRHLPLHRVQITVAADNGRGLRWARALGFEQEGVMRAFTPDARDFARLARVA